MLTFVDDDILAPAIIGSALDVAFSIVLSNKMLKNQKWAQIPHRFYVILMGANKSAQSQETYTCMNSMKSVALSLGGTVKFSRIHFKMLHHA